MALLSYSLVEKIIGVAKSYADEERARLNRLDDDGKVVKPAKPPAHADKPDRRAAG